MNRGSSVHPKAAHAMSSQEDENLVYPPPNLHDTLYAVPNATWQPQHQQHQQHQEKSESAVSAAAATATTAAAAAIAAVNERSTLETMKALIPPINVPLVLLCLLWYATSAISSTLTKTILTQFPYPVTLSLVQFLLAVVFAVATIQLAQVSRTVYRLLPAGTVSHGGLRAPSRQVIGPTLPMGLFQLVGHIFSHKATSLIPVSLVHTIKALSPLLTVLAYRLLFGIKYPTRTYLTLVPLMGGVVMTCATEFSSQLLGVTCAVLATCVFVVQNMYSKRLLTYQRNNAEGPIIGEKPQPQQGGPVKLDKLTILCYSSSLAFVFTLPVWLVSEFTVVSSDLFNGLYISPRTGPAGPSEAGLSAVPSTTTTTAPPLLPLFLLNGLSHYVQNLAAFQVLGLVSPVSYTVASLFKRISVISFSIFWFGQHVNPMQGWGILLTVLGVYLYDRVGVERRQQLLRAGLPK